jgi:hypothetical protein
MLIAGVIGPSLATLGFSLLIVAMRHRWDRRQMTRVAMSWGVCL